MCPGERWQACLCFTYDCLPRKEGEVYLNRL